MKDLQAKHKEWCERNFGGREPQVSPLVLRDVAVVSIYVGKMAHHALKAFQGIRGNVDHPGHFKNAVSRVINQCLGTQFPDHSLGLGSHTHPFLPPLLGIIEEVGELSASVFKHEQIDAVGDITLYLIDYCNAAGIDFEDAVRITAEKVHARDWNVNQVNGEVSE